MSGSLHTPGSESGDGEPGGPCRCSGYSRCTDTMAARADSAMSLVVEEQTLCEPAELSLGQQTLAVSCRITVEWLRGIAEPTWYGYFEPVDAAVQVLPGGYRMQIDGYDVQILLRRPVRGVIETRYPFWGIGSPPATRPDA